MLTLTRLDSAQPDFQTRLTRLLQFDDAADAAIEQTVAAILHEVKTRGDAAVLEYTERFDRLPAASLASLELGPAQLQAALAALPADTRQALQTAAGRVRRYHEKQVQESWTYTEDDGTVLGQQVTPLDRVGLYVPGGKAAYPSSVLMNAIPARVAGVGELIMVVPTPDGEQNPLVLAAAAIAGVDRVVPQVDKIVGPGNAYVAAAKRRVFGTVGIDMIAGPSEILVIADGDTPAEWVAMDLFSQAEHDEMAQAILLSPDAAYLDAVAAAIDRLIEDMPRSEAIRTSLTNRGALIKTRDLDDAAAIANFIAPEHLELSVADPDALLPKLRHAGAIFMGRNTCEALGDYCAGPNHVLPTSRTARFSSPLGVYDFQKRSSLIHVSEAGAQTLGRIAATLAYGEGLQAHARSAEYRLVHK
ncbi:MAG: histidinol dehydrogenase [Thiobacillus sp. SCN 63-1177]|nr:MAG: histidinol dehydrogenase [Thiobacillus sp. SCN 63-1177]